MEVFLRILYCSDVPDVEEEAAKMAKFLRENEVPCILVGFCHAPGEATDRLQEMAYVAPLIEQPMIPAEHPIDSYVKGLEGVKKYIKLIKDWVQRRQTEERSSKR